MNVFKLFVVLKDSLSRVFFISWIYATLALTGNVEPTDSGDTLWEPEIWKRKRENMFHELWKNNRSVFHEVWPFGRVIGLWIY
ncbi:hypothetical protein HanPSC8_Chr03g0120791 [Helianthus annuus]|nr:hypothetical protein HanPSC8_Chr03g0120791 [Helianthus annuus]